MSLRERRKQKRLTKAGAFIARVVTAVWLPRMRYLANDTTECPPQRQQEEYVLRKGAALACPIGLDPILRTDAYYMNGACYDIHNLAKHFVYSATPFCPLTKDPVTTARVLHLTRTAALWGSASCHRLKTKMVTYRRDREYTSRTVSLYRSLLHTLCEQVMHMVSDITKQTNNTLRQQRGARDDRHLLNTVLRTPAWLIASDKIAEYHAVLATLSVKHPEAARAIARRNENILTIPLSHPGPGRGHRSAVRIALRMAMSQD